MTVLQISPDDICAIMKVDTRGIMMILYRFKGTV